MLSIKAPLNCRVRPQAVARAPRQAFRVVCHGHGHGGAGPAGTAVLTEKDRGFIAEMRKVAMKLHTKDQSPKEGGKDAPKPGPWTPTRTGYLRFLAESKVVYDTLETLVHTRDEYAMLRGTGLERAHGLAEDLTWFQNTYQLSPPELTEDGPGHTYRRLLEKVAAEDPPAFICHFYNFYFAHTAGGRMIGNKVAGMLLDGHTLEFYKWNTDVQELLEAVRRSINGISEGWSRDSKDHCLGETEASFKYSGLVMKCIADAE